MKKRISSLLAMSILLALPSASFALSVMPTFTDEGIDTTGTAQQTRMYRADLTGLGLSEIGAVTLTDSNSGVGGSTGIYSGFDLDAIFLDVDGDLATDNDRFFADSFLFNAGSIRPGSFAGPSPSGGPTFGSSSPTTVDESVATLNDIDGIFFTSGGLTLGDGGTLTAVFDPTIQIGASLFLFAGEISGSAGETLNGLVEVSDTPPPPQMSAVPLPAGAPLILSGLLVMGIAARRRKQK